MALLWRYVFVLGSSKRLKYTLRGLAFVWRCEFRTIPCILFCAHCENLQKGLDILHRVCEDIATQGETPGKEVNRMGQTDSQFKAFIRFVLDALREIADEPDETKRAAKMEKVLDNLQKTLED